MDWQFDELADKFEEVCERAETEGPQTVVRPGYPTMVILTKADLQKSMRPRRDFKDFLLNAGLDLTGVDLERERHVMREIDHE